MCVFTHLGRMLLQVKNALVIFLSPLDIFFFCSSVLLFVGVRTVVSNLCSLETLLQFR